MKSGLVVKGLVKIGTKVLKTGIKVGPKLAWDVGLSYTSHVQSTQAIAVEAGAKALGFSSSVASKLGSYALPAATILPPMWMGIEAAIRNYDEVSVGYRSAYDNIAADVTDRDAMLFGKYVQDEINRKDFERRAAILTQMGVSLVGAVFLPAGMLLQPIPSALSEEAMKPANVRYRPGAGTGLYIKRMTESGIMALTA